MDVTENGRSASHNDGLYDGDDGYELWDTETANALGAYASREAALQAVSEIVRRYGPSSPEAQSLALYHEERAGAPGETLSGPALLHAAAALRRAVSQKAPVS